MRALEEEQVREDLQRRLQYQKIIKEPQHSTSVELSVLKSIQSEIAPSTTIWETLDNDIFFPKWSFHDSTGITVGKCTGKIHATPEELLAWMFIFDSNQSQQKHIKQNGPNAYKYPNKILRQVNDHHIITYSCRKLPSPIVARIWITRNFWKKMDEENYFLVYKTIEEDNPDLPPNFQGTTLKNFVRGELSMIYSFTKLPFGQTKFTMTARVDIKGSVPKALANRAIKGFMNTVRRAYEYFERDVEVDEMERSGETCL